VYLDVELNANQRPPHGDVAISRIQRRRETTSSNCLSDKSIQYRCTPLAERAEGQIVTQRDFPIGETRSTVRQIGQRSVCHRFGKR
jgi:hypothetical protein